VSTPHDKGIYALGMSVGGITFGAIHVAVWNLDFPTPIEQELWRIASVIITCLLPLALLSYILLTIWAGPKNTFIDPEVKTRWNKWLDRHVFLMGGWGLVFAVIYIIARLLLLVETFRALGFLPPNAFVATWVLNIPSVS
jgi:hypothetical protein